MTNEPNMGDSGTFGSQKTMNAIKQSQTKGLAMKKKTMANKLPSLTNSRPNTLSGYVGKSMKF